MQDSPIAALDIVQRFRQLHVLVIGDVMLDTYLEGDSTRLCSEGPVPVVHKKVEQHLPGGAANTAANVRALGARVSLLGMAGRDRAGTFLRSALRERDVADRWLVEDEEASTLQKTRIVANGQYVVRLDEGNDRCGLHVSRSPFTQSSQRSLLTHLEECYAQCDAVIIDDYGYGVVSDEVIAHLAMLRRQSPRVVLVDSKNLQRFEQLPITAITPNVVEARQLVFAEDEEHTETDSEGDALAQAQHCAQRLLQQFCSDLVVITLAAQGLLFMDRAHRAIHLPAHPVVHAHDVGAGDSFAAAFALALAAHGEPLEAARIGLDAAAIVVSQPRTAVVQYQELLQRVSLRVYSGQEHAVLVAPGREEYAALPWLFERLAEQRRAGRTVVFTNGIFDILHAGHMQLLRQAKALGDILVVGVNSDESTRRLKGAGRPINGERERMALLAALDVVDYVVLFDEDTPIELLRELRPTLHVKGGDYANEVLPEAEVVQASGGQVVILPLLGNLSTSSVIERIVACAQLRQS